MRLGLVALIAVAVRVAAADEIYKQSGEARVFTNAPTSEEFATYENVAPTRKTHEKTPDTPLHGAVAFNRTAEVERLLASGADVNAPGYRGVTPLMRAAQTGNVAMIDLLLAHRARLGASADDGNTALHFAAMSHKAGTIRRLADARANLDVQNSQGQTPLHVAVTNNDQDAVDALVEAGANVHVLDKYNRPALPEKRVVRPPRGYPERGGDWDRPNPNWVNRKR
jgi:ankyrin repeat protein